jgi:ABC-type phosphate/phosphonate transport system substrate-binding protein
VATTERIPGDAYCASPHLTPQTLSKLKRALLVFEPQRDMKKKFLGPVHRITGFVLVNERHYDPIRRMHDLLHGADAKLKSRGPRRPR